MTAIPVTAAPPAEASVPLDRVDRRGCGVIVRLDGAGADLDRLQELGLCPGRRIEVLQAGDPLIVRVFGSRLGLSARLAARIRVRICGPDGCAAG